MDDLSCRCSYFEPHMSLQGNEVLGYLPPCLGLTLLLPSYPEDWACTTVWSRAVSTFAGAAGAAGPAPRQVPMTPAMLGSGYLALHPQFRPPRTDESHHSKATSRGASRVKKQLWVRLPAQSRPSITFSVPTYAPQRLRTCAAPAMLRAGSSTGRLSPNPGIFGSSPG